MTTPPEKSPSPAFSTTTTTVCHDHAPDEHHNDGSKLKTFISILRKFIGVSDLAAVRFSLPSQLLEPIPNLEYWNYLDAPNAFVAIGTADHPIDRMLEVLRFWFTKDLKYAKGKPCKPYNSCLGEFFRCNWETEDDAPRIDTQSMTAKTPGPLSDVSSSTSGQSGATPESRVASTVSISQSVQSPAHPIRVSYLTEQTSHHPPVSAFHISCPAKGLTARGLDQISAKFTGTSIKILPGEHNQGIFIEVASRGNETYRLTHPAAHLGGILRGALHVTVGDHAYVTCPETKLKAILHYYDDGWLGRTTNKVSGIIFRYDPDNDNKHRIKDVPEQYVLVRLGGPWKEKVVFTLGGKPLESHPPEEQTTLVDLSPLTIAPKCLPPPADQLPHESLQLWTGVTQAIRAKQFSKATSLKMELEEAQREKARQRDKDKKPWKPAFFEEALDSAGKPRLSETGRRVLERAQNGIWDLKDLDL